MNEYPLSAQYEMKVIVNSTTMLNSTLIVNQTNDILSSMNSSNQNDDGGDIVISDKLNNTFTFKLIKPKIQSIT